MSRIVPSRVKKRKFNYFIQTMVCFRNQVSFSLTYQIKDHRYFCYILNAHFLKNKQTNKPKTNKFWWLLIDLTRNLVVSLIFLTCFFFSLQFLSQKRRLLFSQISFKFENRYREKWILFRVNNRCIILPSCNTIYFCSQTNYMYLVNWHVFFLLFGNINGSQLAKKWVPLIPLQWIYRVEES